MGDAKILHDLLLEAESLLDRYREKARILVVQTSGAYEGGEPIQFLVNDYDRHKIKLERQIQENR